MVDIWKTLDIKPTDDAKAIRSAYAQKLKTIHAEDDPEAFQLLRQAYESALAQDHSKLLKRVVKKTSPSKSPKKSSLPPPKLSKKPEQKNKIPALTQQVTAMVAEFFKDSNVFLKWVDEKVFSRLDLSSAFQEAILAEWVSREEIDKVLFLIVYQHFNWGAIALQTRHPFVPSLCEIILGHEISSATEYLDQNGVLERDLLRLSALVNDVNRAKQCDQSEINACDAQENTPLHLACEVGAEEMVSYLIECCCDLDAINAQGLTPLIVSVLKGSEEICDLLCEAGADVNFVTENGFSTLNFAAAHSSIDIVNVLCRSEEIEFDSKALAAAVKQNNLKIVKKLVELGCDLDDERGKQFATPLAIAVRYHFNDIAEFLIENGADVDAGRSLSLAAVRGSYAIAKKLIESGAKITLGHKYWGEDPLHYALEYGHFSIADLLFHSLNLVSKDVIHNEQANDISTYIKGATEAGTMGYPSLWDEKYMRYGMGSVMAIARDAFYYSPMLKFIYKRDIPGLKYTLKGKLDQINKADKTYGVTPLYLACQQGYLDCAELLLESGADPNQINTKNSLGPLHIAILSHHNEIVEILLNYGADINLATPPTSYSPLFVAVHAQNVRAFEILMNLDAKDLPSGFYHSALMAACYKNSIDMVKALVERGSDIKQCVNDRYRSLVYIAARYGHVVILNYLLKQGLHPDWICEDAVSLNYDSFKHRNIPFTALSAAIVNTDVKSVRLLLKAGANPNRFSPNGKPPLHFACTHPEMVDRDDRLIKLEEIIKLLIAHGGDINLQDEDGDTFLMNRVREEALSTVIQLIELGADLEVPDAKGFTPYQIALKSENRRIIQALQSAGAGVIDIKACLEKQQVCVREYGLSGQEAVARIEAEVGFELSEEMRYFIQKYGNLEVECFDILCAGRGDGGSDCIFESKKYQLLDNNKQLRGLLILETDAYEGVVYLKDGSLKLFDLDNLIEGEELQHFDHLNQFTAWLAALAKEVRADEKHPLLRGHEESLFQDFSNVPINIEGKIIKGEEKNRFVIVREDQNQPGAFNVVIFDVGDPLYQGGKCWLSNRIELEKYFKKSKMKIEWENEVS